MPSLSSGGICSSVTVYNTTLKKIKCSRETRKVFLNRTSEYVVHTLCPHPSFRINRRQDRGLGTRASCMAFLCGSKSMTREQTMPSAL